MTTPRDEVLSPETRRLVDAALALASALEGHTPDGKQLRNAATAYRESHKTHVCRHCGEEVRYIEFSTASTRPGPGWTHANGTRTCYLFAEAVGWPTSVGAEG